MNWLLTSAAVFGMWVASAFLIVTGAICYAVGFLIGRAISFGLWCWVSLVRGYKDGL